MKSTSLLLMLFASLLCLSQTVFADSTIQATGLSLGDLTFDDCPTNVLQISSLSITKSLPQKLPETVQQTLEKSDAIILLSPFHKSQLNAQLNHLKKQLNSHWQNKFSRPAHQRISALLWKTSKFDAVGSFNQAASHQPPLWVILGQGKGMSMALVTTITPHDPKQALSRQPTLITRKQVIFAGQLSKQDKLPNGYQIQQGDMYQTLASRGFKVCASGRQSISHSNSLLWVKLSGLTL
ncbi:MAG: hypothetical protein CENE_02063 [Candidatus Celerinatantimonas neptuna]|nr:MAG: hypothetical protein CENE_02063 [Candidatus Celerinatantimonas neptuna]